MKLAVVGATGLVGTEILNVLQERDFAFDELIPVASARSAGKTLEFKNKKYTIVTPEEAIKLRPDVAIFSAGGGTSLEYAPKFAEVGTTVIDNSSAWRMDPTKKLVVPEINAHTLTAEDKIIANPNCSTIQMVVVLNPLHLKYGIKRVIASTYQSVTGSGKQAVDQLMDERNGKTPENPAYPHPIDLNILPHIDVFQENGYTKEEMKMIRETNKIMGDDRIKVTATTVRVPVVGGHAESLNIEFENEFELPEVREILASAPNVVLQDNPAENVYPMPIWSHKKDETFVGRLRRDETQPKTLNAWVVADNLRKGAATNAVQIAEYLKENNLI